MRTVVPTKTNCCVLSGPAGEGKEAAAFLEVLLLLERASLPRHSRAPLLCPEDTYRISYFVPWLMDPTWTCRGLSPIFSGMDGRRAMEGSIANRLCESREVLSALQLCFGDFALGRLGREAGSLSALWKHGALLCGADCERFPSLPPNLM